MKLKRFICMCLSTIFISSINIPVFANDKVELYKNYDWSTINFENSEKNSFKTTQNNIDEAIQYVKTLDLTEVDMVILKRHV